MNRKHIFNRASIVAVVILLVALGTGLLVVRNLRPSFKKPTSEIQYPRKESDFNTKQDSEQAIRNQSPPPLGNASAGSESDGAKTVSPSVAPATANLKPIITGIDGDSKATATQIAVDALSDGATSGSCTLKLLQNGNSFSVTEPIVQIATYYGCSTLKLDKSKLVAGAATITIYISSPSASGTSDARTITVVK